MHVYSQLHSFLVLHEPQISHGGLHKKARDPMEMTSHFHLENSADWQTFRDYSVYWENDLSREDVIFFFSLSVLI